MARPDPLTGLIDCLRGTVPEGADWAAIVGLANKTLCSPMMAARLEGAGRLADVPEDVRAFLGEMLARNAERNQRLLAQLGEATAALSMVGVQPVLLKGAAWLASAAAQERGARMLADLDLLVPTGAFFAAIDRLRAIGYELEAPALRPDVPAVLWRTQDPGTIDLHSDYGSPATLFYRYEDLARDAKPPRLLGSGALLPSAVAGVAILLLHDQLKGRDYLRGRVDLRHLIDIQYFASAFGEGDWAELDRLFTSAYARQAMRTQLLTARRLLGMNVPKELVRGLRPRVQFARRQLQRRWPALTPILTLLSLFDPAYLAARRTARRASAHGECVGGGLPRRDSLFRLFLRDELGKI
ncbi:nucleotidyltransferase family protein [Sphingobium mellinum]|uniref:nucleotidyltransferase family protein n=1 Tax=Sphingobium mellinum TaxID=1387166 RepID=UPI0030EE117C